MLSILGVSSLARQPRPQHVKKLWYFSLFASGSISAGSVSPPCSQPGRQPHGAALTPGPW